MKEETKQSRPIMGDIGRKSLNSVRQIRGGDTQTIGWPWTDYSETVSRSSAQRIRQTRYRLKNDTTGSHNRITLQTHKGKYRLTLQTHATGS